MKTFIFICSLILGAADMISTNAVFADSLNKNNDREITVFIRVDDIFMKESHIQPQEINAFLDIAEKHNAHIILATIPNRLLQPPNKDGKMTKQLISYAERGHQIVQHGFDHRCPFTKTTDWEFYTPDIKGYTDDQIIAKISEGKHLLEAVIGKKITNYVGPGLDNNFALEKNEIELRELGFLWLTDPKTTKPYFDNDKAYFFSLNEYAWALTDENYKKNMNEAKEYFKETINKQDYFGFLFHDHFTRKNYNNGITLKWFDEFMTWMESQPDIKIKYSTLDEYYSKNVSDFKKDF